MALENIKDNTLNGNVIIDNSINTIKINGVSIQNTGIII